MILTSVALQAGHPTALVAAPDISSGNTAFRDEVVAILHSDFPGVEVTLDQDPEQIRIGRSTLYLGNLRRKVGKSTGASRRAEILEFVGSLASAKPKVAAPAESLMRAAPRLRLQLIADGTCGPFRGPADEDGYVAARMLLPVVMNQIREGLKTPSMVVGVPTRDILIAWSHDSENRDRLARLVIATMRDGPYSRSPELFHFSADGLRPLNGGELFDHKRQ